MPDNNNNKNNNNDVFVEQTGKSFKQYVYYLVPKSKSASLQDNSGSLRRESSSLNLRTSSPSTNPGVSRNTS